VLEAEMLNFSVEDTSCSISEYSVSDSQFT